MRRNTKYLGFFTVIGLFFGSPAGLSPISIAEARTPASAPRPDAEKMAKAQEAAKDGRHEEAIKIYKSLMESESDRSKRAVVRMALAVTYFQIGKDKDSEEQFTKAIEDGTRIADYAWLHLGILKRKAGKSPEAIQYFTKVIDSSVPAETEHEARYQLGELLLQKEDWKGARLQFDRLRKNSRSTPRYPEIIYNLAHTEIKSKQKSSACKWAREIYSKYPGAPMVSDWGPELAKNKLAGESLSFCSSSTKDLRTRVRRLWLAGEADRAARELTSLKESREENDDDIPEVDSMLANHLLSEGKIEEAQKIVFKYKDAQKNSPKYMMLLGKIHSRAGDYKAAIESYRRAFELAPKGNAASDALFQAAFTSYQTQDYEGATESFNKLIKAFPRSKLARDSKWHLAWIRYLRKDYMGAHQEFASIAKTASRSKVIRRGRRRIVVKVPEVASQDRLRYWSAMSLLKAGKGSEAAPIFQSLVRDPAIGYYSVISYYRLLSIPGASLPPGIENRLGLKKADPKAPGVTPSDEELLAAAEAAEAARAEEESPTNEELTEAIADASDDVEETSDVAEGGEEEDTDGNPDAKIAFFSDSSLIPRFERARDLVAMGLNDYARRELREIERRARSNSDRRLLMTEFAQVRQFDRSSYLAEVGFGSLRLKSGLAGESREYWEYAYPRAYEAVVTKSAKSTAVPEELIWGIMRAESHYRDDAHSPVGAMGLMQLMPFTGRQVASLLKINSFETHSMLDPTTNIRLGSRYLQRLVEMFSGSIPLVAASYNAGPHRAHAWVNTFGSLEMDEFIEHIPFVETRNYVKKVVRNYQIYGLLYGRGSRSLSWLIQPVGVDLKDKVFKEVW